jgi:hypothetical protein
MAADVTIPDEAILTAHPGQWRTCYPSKTRNSPMLTSDQFVRLAVAGGSFTLDAQKFQVDELVRIAVAAWSKGGRISIKNAQIVPIDNLVRIAVAGEGTIFFEGL